MCPPATNPFDKKISSHLPQTFWKCSNSLHSIMKQHDHNDLICGIHSMMVVEKNCEEDCEVFPSFLAMSWPIAIWELQVTFEWDMLTMLTTSLLLVRVCYEWVMSSQSVQFNMSMLWVEQVSYKFRVAYEFPW